jgi:hypothetical protein
MNPGRGSKVVNPFYVTMVLPFFPLRGCDLQEKLIRAGFFVDPEGVFKSIEEFWDGEI